MEPRAIHEQPGWLGAWLQPGLGWVDAAHRRVHDPVRTRRLQPGPAGFVGDAGAVLQRVKPFSSGDRRVDSTDARSVRDDRPLHGKSPFAVGPFARAEGGARAGRWRSRRPDQAAAERTFTYRRIGSTSDLCRRPSGFQRCQPHPHATSAWHERSSALTSHPKTFRNGRLQVNSGPQYPIRRDPEQ